MPSVPLTAESRTRLLPLLALSLIVAGGALHLGGLPTAGDAVWAATVAIMLVPLTVSIARTLAAGRVGVDAIAQVAMAGALAVGEYLAGAVIALMLSGGNALEASASRRARQELTALLERMPTVAHRRADGGWQEVGVGELAVGDTVLVRAGELVPVDGAGGHGRRRRQRRARSGPCRRWHRDERTGGDGLLGDGGRGDRRRPCRPCRDGG